MDELDRRVREKLRTAKPNQQQLAARLGRSQPWVSKYLAGGPAAATIDDIAAIAEFLNTTVSALIDEKPLPTMTSTQRRAQEIAALWIRAKPFARRCIHDYLKTFDNANLNKKR
jgi:transcriptional regulator with XRE-family HTH domain